MARAKPELVGALDRLLNRELHAQGTAFSEAVADRLGLTLNDLKCLELVRSPPAGAAVNAGQLAEHTGLTTGAITGMLDRLERAQLVYREKDPSDRRQVRVRLTVARGHELDGLLSARDEAWHALCAKFSEAELKLIAGFLQQAEELLARQVVRTRAASSAGLPSAGRELSAPLGRTRQGTLTCAHTPQNLVLTSTAEAVLYRLRAEEPVPSVHRKLGLVTLSAPETELSARHACSLELAQAVPWSIVLRSGAANLRADLRALVLRSLQIEGGVSGAVVELPRADGEVALRIAGGVHRLRLLRPRDAALRLHIERGASGLALDGMQLAAVGGDVRWETANFARAEDRFDVVMMGGASELTLDVF